MKKLFLLLSMILCLSACGQQTTWDTVPGYGSQGMAEFSGYETVPTGALSCNILPQEVYANPDEPQYLLFPTFWYTHTDQEEEETKHTGYDVYVLLPEQ